MSSQQKTKDYQSYQYLSLREILSGYQLSQALFTLHRLKLPEYLHQHGPQPLSSLAETFGVDAKLLEQLLKIAETVYLLQKDEQQHYGLTTKGVHMCPDATNSIIPLLGILDDGYSAWGALQHSLQTGQVAFEQAHKMDIYDYFSQHPEKNTYFNNYMEQTTHLWLSKVGQYYEFSGHLIDIGGNKGALTALLLQQFPELQATLFDLEQAMKQADELLSVAGVSDRCQVVAGNFFEPETIPQDGDIYLISRVLLNWNDDQVVEILQNCRQVMPQHSKLLILDILLDSSTAGLLAGLNLWVMFGARSRTQTEFEQLVQQAGFTELRWIDMDMAFLLEASPA